MEILHLNITSTSLMHYHPSRSESTGGGLIRLIYMNTGKSKTLASKYFLNQPTGMTTDNDGILYISSKHMISRILPLMRDDAQLVTGSNSISGTKTGNLTSAQFKDPQGIVMDSSW